MRGGYYDKFERAEIYSIYDPCSLVSYQRSDF
jgi:hypothetical protein